jgi:hypothetical protein
VALTLGKEVFFAECHTEALDKEPYMGTPLADSLSSAGRQTLGKDAISVTRRRDGCFSLPSTTWHSAKSLPIAREKVPGKEGFADALCAEPSLPNTTLGKEFDECF